MTLRFGPVRVRTTVHWPAGETVWLALVLGDELSPLDRWLAGSVVVAIDGGHPGSIELATLGWVAEHAGELGADGMHVLVAGGARAARLALDARDRGWAEVRRQLLVHPAFTAQQPMPSNVVGAPPATVVCSGRRRGDGSRYVMRLRAAGVAVDEVHDDECG